MTSECHIPVGNQAHSHTGFGISCEFSWWEIRKQSTWSEIGVLTAVHI